MASATQAFVANYNEAGYALRWNLRTVDELVATNSVNPITRAIRFHLAASGWSVTNRVAELNALRASFAQWQSVPGTLLKFEDAGTISGAVDVNTIDGTNIVFWAKQSTIVNGGTDSISGRLAVTYFDYIVEDNTLTDADIVLNGLEFNWFTDFSTTNVSDRTYFVEGIAVHEIGHWIGLEHSPVGGATMMWRALSGIGVAAGLSPDDVSGVRHLYGRTEQLALLGELRGSVLLNGAAVFGAAVLAEDHHGNLAAGTLTHRDGRYALPALIPGDYRVRATPLDPGGSGLFLIRGTEISRDYAQAQTSFRPSAEQTGHVNPGGSAEVNLNVASGTSPFRIIYTREPSTDPIRFEYFSAPASIQPGSSNLYVGVLAHDLPLTGLDLKISGDGISWGEVFRTVTTFGERGLFVPLTVQPSAAPGSRTFKVIQGTETIYVNGYLDILPAFPDYNFDGLDDRFQRQYFAPFTVAEAAPSADPDLDGFTNEQEFSSGSAPNDPASVKFKVRSATLTQAGTLVQWQAAKHRRFQLHGRDDASGAPWVAVGSPVTASSELAQQIDPRPTRQLRFYRVELLP